MAWLTIAVSIFLKIQGLRAQKSQVTCSPSFSWAENDKGQGPCEVAALLQSSCRDDTNFTISPLAPNEVYLGPGTTNASDGCACNSVVYSLMSVCAACHDRFFIDWPSWTKHCTKTYLSKLPSPFPSEIMVPSWAYIDISASCNRLDMDEAKGMAEHASADKSGMPQTHSSNDGKRRTSTIVGAVVGSSVGVFAIVLGGILVIRRRRRSIFKDNGNSKNLRGIRIPRHRNSLWGTPSFTYSPLDMDAVNRAREAGHSPAPSRISLPSELHYVSGDTAPCSPAAASSELYGSLSHSEKAHDGQNVQGSPTSAPSAHYHSLRRIALLHRGNTVPAGFHPSPGEEDAGVVGRRGEENIDSVR